ncbi:hypothetical protein ACJX0J_020157 [Zea mays]
MHYGATKCDKNAQMHYKSKVMYSWFSRYDMFWKTLTISRKTKKSMKAVIMILYTTLYPQTHEPFFCKNMSLHFFARDCILMLYAKSLAGEHLAATATWRAGALGAARLGPGDLGLLALIDLSRYLWCLAFIEF